MYTILVQDDHSLLATQRERIMQRSKLVDEVWFLVKPTYKVNENDMSVFEATLEYVLPGSKSYHSLGLIKDEKGYGEYLKYVVPLDSNLSAEAGDIELQLTFTYTGFDAEGKNVQKVRKTKTAKLHITPIAAWSNIIPDSALSGLDQRIIKMQAQINELEQHLKTINQNQDDNLV